MGLVARGAADSQHFPTLPALEEAGAPDVPRLLLYVLKPPGDLVLRVTAHALCSVLSWLSGKRFTLSWPQPDHPGMLAVICHLRAPRSHRAWPRLHHRKNGHLFVVQEFIRERVWASWCLQA